MTQHDPSLPSQRPPPFSQVCVATDFSAGGEEALARVRHLPLASRARITVVHVLSERIPSKARAQTEKLARKRLEQAVKGLRKTSGGRARRDLRISSELCHGQPYVELIRHARAVGAELLVVGRHGRRPVRDLFIGSTAESVIRAGELPVLVVSGKVRKGYQRPLVAVDLGDTGRSVVSTALRVVEPEVTSATLMHAYHVPFEGFVPAPASPGELTELRREYKEAAAAGLAKLQASLEELGVQWQTTLIRGDPRTAVLAEAARRRADLVALGTHGRSGLSHALLGSVAGWIIQAAECDVLVSRPARVSFKLP